MQINIFTKNYKMKSQFLFLSSSSFAYLLTTSLGYTTAHNRESYSLAWNSFLLLLFLLISTLLGGLLLHQVLLLRLL